MFLKRIMSKVNFRMSWYYLEIHFNERLQKGILINNPMKLLRWRSEDEMRMKTFPCLLSFHYVKIHDKIYALMMVRALQSKELSKFAALNQKERQDLKPQEI